MSPDEFRRAVTFFREAGLAGRNLFLWHGDERPLFQALGAEDVSVIAAIDLVADLPAGTSDNAVAGQLRDRLAERLACIAKDPAIVVIRDCGLLARYMADYRPLFHWLTSRRLVVMLCPPPDTSRLGTVPDGVVLESGRNVEALQRFVPAGQVVEVN